MSYNFIRKVYSYWRTDIENGYRKVPYNITNPSLRHTLGLKTISKIMIWLRISFWSGITNINLSYKSRAQMEGTPILRFLIFLILFFAIIIAIIRIILAAPARNARSPQLYCGDEEKAYYFVFETYFFYNNSKTSVTRVWHIFYDACMHNAQYA